MNTVVINGHPRKNSFCNVIADNYAEEMSRYGNVKLLNLYDLSFDPNLSFGYKENKLEKDLTNAQSIIYNADHLVFVFPLWWWSMPALLKGFIERTFVPGFAFEYNGKESLPQQLLKGKTATLLITMDSPSWYYNLWMKSAGHLIFKRGILNFCGITKIKTVTFQKVKYSSDLKRKAWLSLVKETAKMDSIPRPSIFKNFMNTLTGCSRKNKVSCSVALDAND